MNQVQVLFCYHNTHYDYFIQVYDIIPETRKFSCYVQKYTNSEINPETVVQKP